MTSTRSSLRASPSHSDHASTYLWSGLAMQQSIRNYWFSLIWEESACAVIRFARVTYIQDSDGRVRAATNGVCRRSKIYAEYRPYGHLIYLCHVNPVHSYHLHIILTRSRRNIPQIILVIAGIGRWTRAAFNWVWLQIRPPATTDDVTCSAVSGASSVIWLFLHTKVVKTLRVSNIALYQSLFINLKYICIFIMRSRCYYFLDL